MHEGVIANNILDTVEEHAQGKKVKAIFITIGQLSGVSPEALAFHLEYQLKEKGWEGTTVKTDRIPTRYHCACGTEYEPDDFMMPCPACRGFERKLVQGGDCVVENIEVYDG